MQKIRCHWSLVVYKKEVVTLTIIEARASQSACTNKIKEAQPLSLKSSQSFHLQQLRDLFRENLRLPPSANSEMFLKQAITASALLCLLASGKLG